jgi:hypothetical protein
MIFEIPFPPDVAVTDLSNVILFIDTPVMNPDIVMTGIFATALFMDVADIPAPESVIPLDGMVRVALVLYIPGGKTIVAPDGKALIAAWIDAVSSVVPSPLAPKSNTEYDTAVVVSVSDVSASWIRFPWESVTYSR